MRAYPRLPQADPEGRELAPRVVDDALGREKSALKAHAEEIEEASRIRPQAEIAVGIPRRP